MKTPLHEVLRRIRPLAAIHQADHLRTLIACEKNRSVRRVELESALRSVVLKQLRRECRR